MNTIVWHSSRNQSDKQVSAYALDAANTQHTQS